MAFGEIGNVKITGFAGGALGGLTSVGPTGSGGGSPFQDTPPEGFEVAEVRTRSGLFMDSIQVIYRKRDNFGDIIVGPLWGATGPADDRGSDNNPIIMRPGEFIVGISGRSGVYVDSLQIQTNFQLYNRFGGSGGGDYVYQAEQGEEIVGFFGRSGWYIDSIGVLVRSGR